MPWSRPLGLVLTALQKLYHSLWALQFRVVTEASKPKKRHGANEADGGF